MNHLEHPTYLKLFNNYYRWVDKKFPEYSDKKKESFTRFLVEKNHSDLLHKIECAEHYKKNSVLYRNKHNNHPFYRGHFPSANLEDAQPGQKFKYVTQRTNKQVLLECIERKQYSSFSGNVKKEVAVFDVISKTETKRRIIQGGKALQITDEDFDYWKMIFEEEQQKRPTD
jgi:hypothetical protein